MAHLLRDTHLLFAAHLRATLRTPVWVIIGLFQPICYLLLFAPLLNRVAGVSGFPSGPALNVFAPGLLVMMGLYGVGFAGFGLIADLRAGVVERLRVTPASRLALLLGMVLRDVLILIVQCALLTGLAVLMGMRPDAAGAALTLGLIVLIGLVMSSCSYALAIATKDENALASSINFLAIPLLLLSGVMLPLALAPDALRTLASFNPLAHAVDAARALMVGRLTDGAVLPTFALFGTLAVLTLLWAARSMRSATA
jgi:ABC-2 type transport system permease protein